MKPARVRRHVLALVLLALPVAVLAAPAFLDLRAIAPLRGDAAAGLAKATVCMACHGPAGISAVPMFPNLAGQKAEYLYWQLVEFKRVARPDSPMTAQVAPLGEADLRNLAAYFASLTPAEASSTGATAGVDRGGHLFRAGDPAKGVPPCQGCHGTAGDGHPLALDAARYRAYPILRGQHAEYVTQRLKDFRDDKNTLSSNDRIMRGVAHNLDDVDARDIAAWLQAAR